MRDGDKLRERQDARWLVAAGTLGGLVLVAGVFAGAFILGRRAAVQGATLNVQADTLERLDAERQAYDKLTFYQQLSAVRPSPSPAAPQTAQAAVQPAPPSTAVPARPGPMPEPAAPTRSPNGWTAGPARAGEYTVQVSAFQSRAEAKAFAASLQRKGFAPFIVEKALADKGTWYRVRLGRFDDEAAATRAKGDLARADIPAWVLRSD